MSLKKKNEQDKKDKKSSSVGKESNKGWENIINEPFNSNESDKVEEKEPQKNVGGLEGNKKQVTFKATVEIIAPRKAGSKVSGSVDLDKPTKEDEGKDDPGNPKATSKSDNTGEEQIEDGKKSNNPVKENNEEPDNTINKQVSSGKFKEISELKEKDSEMNIVNVQASSKPKEFSKEIIPGSEEEHDNKGSNKSVKDYVMKQRDDLRTGPHYPVMARLVRQEQVVSLRID